MIKIKIMFDALYLIHYPEKRLPNLVRFIDKDTDFLAMRDDIMSKYLEKNRNDFFSFLLNTGFFIEDHADKNNREFECCIYFMFEQEQGTHYFCQASLDLIFDKRTFFSIFPVRFDREQIKEFCQKENEIAISKFYSDFMDKYKNIKCLTGYRLDTSDLKFVHNLYDGVLDSRLKIVYKQYFFENQPSDISSFYCMNITKNE